MARTRTITKKIVASYRTAIQEKLNVQGVLVFGSYASGRSALDSDLDLIVLSQDFKRMSFIKRLELLNRLRRGPALSVPMDIVGLTLEEFRAFKQSDSPNLRKVYREAKQVYP